MVISSNPYIEQSNDLFITEDGFKTNDFGQALQHAWDIE